MPKARVTDTPPTARLKAVFKGTAQRSLGFPKYASGCNRRNPASMWCVGGTGRGEGALKRYGSLIM
eukprot:13160085-Alexandrium_andersonii.AAC.1